MRSWKRCVSPARMAAMTCASAVRSGGCCIGSWVNMTPGVNRGFSEDSLADIPLRQRIRAASAAEVTDLTVCRFPEREGHAAWRERSEVVGEPKMKALFEGD